MLDTATLKSLEVANVAIVVKETPVPRRSIDEIKATLAKARVQVHSKRISEIKEKLTEIEDSCAEIKQRETTILTLLKAHNSELNDHLATLDEVRAFAEMLKQAGEDPVQTERQTVLLVNEIKEKIKGCGENTKLLEKEKAELARTAGILREELARLTSGNATTPTPRTPTEIHRFETVSQRKNERLEKCRPEIVRIFKEVGELPTKLTGLSGDINRQARTLFVQVIAAEIRNMQQALTAVLIEDERYTLQQSLFSLCGVSKHFDLFYIDALNTRIHKPRDFPSWKEYDADSRNQKMRFFNTVPDAPAAPRYGLVRPAESVQAPFPPAIPAPPPVLQQPVLQSPKPENINAVAAQIVAEVVKEIAEPSIESIVATKKKETGQSSDPDHRRNRRP